MRVRENPPEKQRCAGSCKTCLARAFIRHAYARDLQTLPCFATPSRETRALIKQARNKRSRLRNLQLLPTSFSATLCPSGGS